MGNLATLKDVAKKAGVSVSTVSYVINGKKKVKEETRQRIFAVADELNYSPNNIARGLKTNSTKTIGVIVTNLNDLFFTDVIRAIEYTAHEHGYSVILCDTDNSADMELEKLSNLLSQQIDGLIFAGTGRNKSPLPSDLKIPVVSIDRVISGGNCSIVVDNVLGGKMATEYLIQKEMTPIAIITYSTLISTFFDRVYGYRKALEENGIEYDPELVVETEFATYSEGYDAAVRLLNKNIKFKSVFTGNDLLAIGAMRAFIDHGLRIPEDVGIIGYDDIQISRMLIPSLTTVKQPKYEMGKLAMEMMMKLILKEEINQKMVVLGPELIVRESVF